MDDVWMLHGCCIDAVWMWYGCCMDALWRMLHGDDDEDDDRAELRMMLRTAMTMIEKRSR